MGIPIPSIIKSIGRITSVAGRFEIISKGKKRVIVDYSHTPDSLEKTLQAIKNVNKDKASVITVFGCGGNRDKTKRPLMGKIASDNSDKVIITSDNPRNEEPMLIIDEIIKGIKKKNYIVIEDRAKAIEFAIKDSPKNSVILIAGKGHEDYQIIGNEKKHFSDQEIAKEILNK